MDRYSRKIVGWKLSQEIDSNLTLGALRMALASREIKGELVHHSDRGVQYASGVYINQLEVAGITVSMGRKGNPYDNGAAESLNKTIKYEEVYLDEYDSFEEAEQKLKEFIEVTYNTLRLHSGLGYLTPAEFERAYYSNNRS
jgi:transposase InsO family protein